MSKRISDIINEQSDPELKETFKDTQIVLGLRQPKNLLRHLTQAHFSSIPNEEKVGLFKCNNNACVICKLYVQECKEFECANGYIWKIRCFINCKSRNVLYYLKCNMCNGAVTYTGKTNIIRPRTNNHITCCRNGTGSDKFDKHVYNCGIRNNCLKEPFFKLYAFAKLSDENQLLAFEKCLHRKQYDTIYR